MWRIACLNLIITGNIMTSCFELSCIVDNIVADDLVPCLAKLAAATILTYTHINPVAEHEGLNSLSNIAGIQWDMLLPVGSVTEIDKADSRFALIQWEAVLLCTGVSHWLGEDLESTLEIDKAVFDVVSPEPPPQPTGCRQCQHGGQAIIADCHRRVQEIHRRLFQWKVWDCGISSMLEIPQSHTFHWNNLLTMYPLYSQWQAMEIPQSCTKP